MLTVSVFSSMYRSYSQRRVISVSRLTTLPRLSISVCKMRELISRELHLLAVASRSHRSDSRPRRRASMTAHGRRGRRCGAKRREFCHKHGGVERLCDKNHRRPCLPPSQYSYFRRAGDENDRHGGYFSDLAAPVVAVKNGRVMSIRTRCGSKSVNLRRTSRKIADSAG